MTTDTLNESPPTAPNQAILFPAYTGDYRVAKGDIGYGLFASRKIKKGEIIMDEHSIEYSFSDVMNGDKLLFDRYKKASKKGKQDIPHYHPISTTTLLKTHGVPCLYPDPSGETGGTIRWRLEVPGMLINHSCDPNINDFPPNSETGEGYASRKIRKGEELTFDYVLQYYDHGPFFDPCLCGSSNCRGKMMGFKALSDEEKERLFPAASKAVQAMYLADIGKGPPLKYEQQTFSPRVSNPGILRLVCPPPSHALAKIEVRCIDDDQGTFALYSLKDCKSGQEFSDFFQQTWPDAPKEFDMVFGSSLIGGNDPPEGTVVRMDARKYGAPRNKGGHLLFSGWELLTGHSCEPNIVHDDSDEESDCDSEDEGYWSTLQATKDIKVGDKLTLDYNCLFWDRTEDGISVDECHCGAESCTGTTRGFKFLPPKAQELRTNKPCEGQEPAALSDYVLAMWRNDPEQGANAPPPEESESDDDSSSSKND